MTSETVNHRYHHSASREKEKRRGCGYHLEKVGIT